LKLLSIPGAVEIIEKLCFVGHSARASEIARPTLEEGTHLMRIGGHVSGLIDETSSRFGVSPIF
jgi:hypothetical protein